MLWGVPKAQQQPFSSMAVAAQVWQWFGELGRKVRKQLMTALGVSQEEEVQRVLVGQ